MKKKTVYVVQGYEFMSPEGQLSDVTTFEVYANTEIMAIEMAKTYTLHPKKFYRIERVIETYK